MTRCLCTPPDTAVGRGGEGQGESQPPAEPGHKEPLKYMQEAGTCLAEVLELGCTLESPQAWVGEGASLRNPDAQDLSQTN